MTTETQIVADLATASAEIKHVGDAPFVALHSDYRVHDLEHLLPRPTRKSGKVTLRDAASFITYVNSEKTESTRLYCSMNPPSFEAVFNDHLGANIGWRDHGASYSCPLSVEWKTWTGSDGKKMSQTDFAQFIETNLPDIAHPPAADMLEISRSLEAKKKVNFSSGIRLSNGQNELTYEEQISGTAAKGRIAVPEEFVVGIPVLEGGARYGVSARLRYRIGDGGQLVMWYELVRPHKIIEDAAKDVWKTIHEGTGIEILNGYHNN